MKTYVFTESELSAFANQVKDQIAIQTGWNDLDNYIVIAAEPSFFGRIKAKLFGDVKDQLVIVITKLPPK